jgi:lipid II isoglutaminyl synthase (glutamine-hydrolysing)
MPVRVPLRAEIAGARAAGALSRLFRAGGGTTLPGKLLAKLDPSAVAVLADRLSEGSVLISATNGKTTTSAMAAEILRPRYRLAFNSAGANLVSGVASALLEARDPQLGLFEVDEGALPEIALRVRPRILCLGNLFRDQLDRYGELELVAGRWRDTVASLPDTVIVVNGDDPLVGDLARYATPGRAVVFGLDDPRVARPSLQHAADSKHCLNCGTSYVYAAAYVGHLGDYSCPNCGAKRPQLDVRGTEIALHGADSVAFTLEAQEGSARVELSVPGLYNVYNAVAAAALCFTAGITLDEVVTGLRRFAPAFGRFERIPVRDRRLLILLVKNPAGANEAVRTLVDRGGQRVALVALNDDIADGRDVSWIWDVDFEPFAEGCERIVATGSRAAEIALRFAYGGFDRERLDVVPDIEEALDLALELTAPGEELVVLPTYTAMLALRGILTQRGHARHYWENTP